jgi:hypothetical protein
MAQEPRWFRTLPHSTYLTPWASGSPCSSLPARVSAAASSRHTGVPWCAFVGPPPSLGSLPSRQLRRHRPRRHDSRHRPTRGPRSRATVGSARSRPNVLMDGTPAEDDRVDDSRADFSHQAPPPRAQRARGCRRPQPQGRHLEGQSGLQFGRHFEVGRKSGVGLALKQTGKGAA